MNGVSLIVPAYNAEATLQECLRALSSLDWGQEIEIILVNDGSTDKTVEIVTSFSGVKVIDVSHSGAARATNLGIKAARYDIVALIDADVILERDWLQKITRVFDDPDVAAVGGFVTTANKSIIGKIAGYDVEFRLERAPEDIDHLSTANTAYRRQVLSELGYLNEELKAGYDVDLSRRLKAAGYKLLLRKNARCRHYWKDNIMDYLRQQYYYAYYRTTLAWKLGKVFDKVSGPGMFIQVPFTALVLFAALFGSLAFPWALSFLLLMPLIHLPETILLFYKRKNFQVLSLPFLFTLRNLTWVWAATRWLAKSVTRLIFRAVLRPDAGSVRQ